jgi:hypothetical protein
MAKTSQREHFVGDESNVMVADYPGVERQLQWYSVSLERLKTLIIEAYSPEEAAGIYNKEMGIIYTVHKHDVQRMTGDALSEATQPKVSYSKS